MTFLLVFKDRLYVNLAFHKSEHYSMEVDVHSHSAH